MHYIVSFSSTSIAMTKEENERPDENDILPSQRELLWTTHDHLYSWKVFLTFLPNFFLCCPLRECDNAILENP